jgi:hypothetical protein
LFHDGYAPGPNILFANVGKYYLVDSGYANKLGYLAPYKGSKYHLQDFRGDIELEGKEEIFNYALFSYECNRKVFQSVENEVADPTKHPSVCT